MKMFPSNDVLAFNNISTALRAVDDAKRQVKDELMTLELIKIHRRLRHIQDKLRGGFHIVGD
jgi:hypothetical protein